MLDKRLVNGSIAAKRIQVAAALFLSVAAPFLAFVAFGAPGCGGPGHVNVPVAPLPDKPKATCLEWADAFCTKLEACAPDDVTQRYSDVPTCKARAKIRCNADVEAPGSSLAPEAIEACVKALPDVSCVSFVSDLTVLDRLPKVCRPSGALADGSACGTDVQCRSTFCNREPIRLGRSTCGKCEPLRAEGETCSLYFPCREGLGCTKAGVCTSLLGRAGDLCDEGACEVGFACVNGKCAPLGKDGEKCNTLGVGAPRCVPWLKCSEKTWLCGRGKLVQVGDVCGPTIADVWTGCRGGATCKFPSGGTRSGSPTSPGTCLPPEEDRAACGGRTGNFTCLSPARCLADECSLPDHSNCK